MRAVMPVVLWQAITAVVAGMAFLLAGKVAAYSALLGGLVCVIPNAWYALRLLAKSGEGDSRAFYGAAFSGEVIKLVLCGSLFALVFTQVRPLHAPALFAGFIACLMVNWFGLLWLDRKQRPPLPETARARTDAVRHEGAPDKGELNDDGE